MNAHTYVLFVIINCLGLCYTLESAQMSPIKEIDARRGTDHMIGAQLRTDHVIGAQLGAHHLLYARQRPDAPDRPRDSGPHNPYKDHGPGEEGRTEPPTTESELTTPGMGDGGAGYANRFTIPTATTASKRTRTTPFRASFVNDCDNLVYYCLKAFKTGRLCGRTIYYIYHDFENYCMLDYVNCIEKYEVWQVVHMGECLEINPLSEYKFYPYEDDSFLDKTHVIEDLQY